MSAHADAPDAFGPEADCCGEHQVRAIGFEKVDGADVGLESLAESDARCW